MASRIAEGETLADVSSEAGIEVTTTEAFSRDGRGLTLGVGPNFINAVFALETGAATEAVMSGTGRYAIAVLDEIQSADMSAESAPFDDLRGQLRRSVQGDVEIAFADALRRKYGVQVNQSLVDNLFDLGFGSP